MIKMHQRNLWAGKQMTHVTLMGGVGWGLAGGLAGTMVMDLVLMGALSVLGQSPLSCFTIVGNTVARFFSILGVERAGGVSLGIATHYLIGPLVGGIFGIAAVQVDALRVGTLKRGILLAVLYVEILSQPILALTPILLKMTTIEILQWFCGSFIMHLLLGIVLGAIVHHGLHLPTIVGHT